MERKIFSWIGVQSLALGWIQIWKKTCYQHWYCNGLAFKKGRSVTVYITRNHVYTMNYLFICILYDSYDTFYMLNTFSCRLPSVNTDKFSQCLCISCSLQNHDTSCFPYRIHCSQLKHYQKKTQESSTMTSKQFIRASSGGTRSGMLITTPGMSASRRHSDIGRVRLENTYHMEPKTAPNQRQIKEIIRETAGRELADEKYSETTCKEKAVNLAEQVKNQIVAMGTDRHKVVTMVMIGPKDASTVAVVSRCLWNEKFDTFVEYTFTNQHLYATILVYGIFQEWLRYSSYRQSYWAYIQWYLT